MTALPTSSTHRLETTLHRRALASRMTRIPMAADPSMNHAAHDDQAHRARRAVQYAAWMAQQTGKLPADLSGFDAEWYEQDGFAMFVRADESQEVAAVVVIPRHMLEFDPERPALALPPGTVEPDRRFG